MAAIACAAVAVRVGDHDAGQPEPSDVTAVNAPTTDGAGREDRPGAGSGGTGPVGGQAQQPRTGGRDEAGAVDAAVAFAAAPQRWLYLSDQEIGAAVAEVASPGAAAALTDETVAEVRAARDELAQSSGRVWWLVHPLAWRVDSLTDSEATVAVWVVTLLSAADVAMPQTEWVSALVDLVWVAGGWRVDGSSERPGPTPMTGPQDRPWDPEPFDDALDGFTRLDGEPVR